MKHLIVLLLSLIAIPSFARDFSFTYEGQTLKYTVLDENAKTCETKRVYIDGSVIIPETVSDGTDNYTVIAIGAESFRNNNRLTEVTIPKSVTTIGEYAFAQCWYLTSVTIPKSVTTIGDYAFEGCLITSVKIPESVITIGKGAFSDCPKLTSVTIPKSVTTIGIQAFAECPDLTSVTIPQSVTTIGTQAFAECTSLTSVTIPGDETTIQSSAFVGCKSLTSVTISGSGTIIGNSAFAGCENLASVTITGTGMVIGDYAFKSCTALNSLKMSDDSVTSIGEEAFCHCEGLTTVTIPATVTSIGADAFWGCFALEVVNTPSIESWLKIEFKSWLSNPTCFAKKLLVNGKAIDTLYIDIDGDNLNPYCFIGAKNLTNVRIRCGEIGWWAFAGCSGIKNLCIEANGIDEHAFENCDELTNIYSLTVNPPVAPVNAFWKYYGVNLYVPVGATRNYKNAEECWWRFSKVYESDFSEIDGIFDQNGIVSEITEIQPDENLLVIDYDKEYEVYNINGERVSDSIRNLSAGMYIIRQGSAVKKIMVK